KPASLVAETMEDIPFDFRALRVILYNKNAHNWGEILRKSIERSLKEVLESPAEAVLPAFLNVKVASVKPTVSAEQRDLIEIKQELELLRREMRIRERRRQITPEEARSLLREMVTREADDETVLDRLRPLGPPRPWIEAEIEEARKQMERGRQTLEGSMRKDEGNN